MWVDCDLSIPTKREFGLARNRGKHLDVQQSRFRIGLLLN